MDVAPSPKHDARVPIPLAISGQNTVLRITFPNRDEPIEPGQLQRDEICYLEAGDFRIDCYTDGSSLNLGPNDSNDLLTDNPMYGLAPAKADEKDAATAMRLYGVLFLIAGSVDRLPATLADYLQSPGTHLNEAIALTDVLLNQKSVRFIGHARGGNFVVTVELTNDGRDKLEDAMDEIGETTGTNQLVRHVRPR
ncbi:MAG TPA: hypothetical protein VGI81_28120 [Tepidisphaeraceae bacterium]